MRCYYVLIHGLLDWRDVVSDDAEDSRPAGFLCRRYVLASDRQSAAEKAFRSVRAGLADWTDGPKMTLETEEISPAPFHKLLRLRHGGHAFYDQE
ncbi:MAG: hypothetical protein QM608_18320 [Caulobacter sp.]